MGPVVADASVLIALSNIGLLDLLEQLVGELVIPPADDLPARRLAKTLGLSIVGTAGLALLAKRKGLVPLVRPVLDALRAKGFRLRQDVYEEILETSGEGEAT